MSYQPPATPTKGPRRTGLIVLGLMLLIAGVGAGIVMYLLGDSQYADAVKNLQRAPVGCDTRFTFTETGTFIFYTETKGSVGDLRGDCANTNKNYDRTGQDPPKVTLTLVNSKGDNVDLARRTGASYDTSGYVGTAISEVTVDKPAQYTLSVVSDDVDFAISVGRNPKDDADQLQTIAVIVAGVGLVLGALLILLGLRRKPLAGAEPASFVTSSPPIGALSFGPNYGGAPPTSPPFGDDAPAAPPLGGPFAPPPPPSSPPPSSPPPMRPAQPPEPSPPGPLSPPPPWP